MILLLGYSRQLLVRVELGISRSHHLANIMPNIDLLFVDMRLTWGTCDMRKGRGI